MESIRAAIIGFAHMHVNEISQYILETDGITLCGIADVHPQRPELVKKRYTRDWNLENVASAHHLTPFDDYREMLDTVKPDVCFLLCANVNKARVAQEIASRGIHVSVEKPMAVTLEEAGSIAALADRYHVDVLVNWPTSWRPYIRCLDAAYRTGIVGKLKKLYYINGHTGPLGVGASHRGVDAAAEGMTDAEKAATWWYQSDMGGGAFLDIGCYGAMYSTWFQEENALSVYAKARNLNTPFMEPEDNAAMIVDYPSSMSVLEATWTMPNKFLPTGPVLCCEEGVLYTTADKQVKAMTLTGAEIPLRYEAPFCDPNLPALMVRHYREGAPWHLTVTADFNVRMMALLDAAIRSSKENRPVPVVY